MFVYWYLIRFAGRSPFSHSALDMKAFAMALLGRGYRDASKHNPEALVWARAAHPPRAGRRAGARRAVLRHAGRAAEAARLVIMASNVHSRPMVG